MKVCIVIPMYNEERVARLSIETTLQYVDKLPPEITVVVVNDGSEDATEQIVEQIAGGLPMGGKVVLISHRTNRGYGAAIRTGIGFAVDNNYDYVLFMDSDMTNHPKYVERFYERMADGYDYIKATRYVKDSAVEGVPLFHRILSAAGNSVARVLYRLPLTDFTNGFRAVKVDVLRRMNLEESGFAIIMEELWHAKYLAHSFCDVPYVLTCRGDSRGRSKFSYGPRTYFQYLRYPLKSFLGIGHIS